MARINVFDSTASVDSAGNAVNFNCAAALTEATATRTYPVRIYSPDEDTTVVGWEFVSSFPAANAVLALRWWQEFYCDKASLASPPGSARDWLGLDPSVPWMRETFAVFGGGAFVDIAPPIRRTAMQRRVGSNFESLYVPLTVYGLWVKLALYVDIASCTAITSPNDCRVQVYAHVGAHDERQYLIENGSVPYAYNAFK